MQKLYKDINLRLTSEHYKQLKFTLDEDKKTKIKRDSVYLRHIAAVRRSMCSMLFHLRFHLGPQDKLKLRII